MKLHYKDKTYRFEVREETDKAIRIRSEFGYGFWVPRSVISEQDIISDWGWKNIFRYQSLVEAK